MKFLNGETTVTEFSIKWGSKTANGFIHKSIGKICEYMEVNGSKNVINVEVKNASN